MNERTHFVFACFLAIVVILAFSGGGTIPAVLVCATSLALVLWIGSTRVIRAEQAQHVAPVRIAPAGLAWILFILLLAATTVPLPKFMDACAGPVRTEQDSRAYNAAQDAVDLGLVEQRPSTSFSLTRNRSGTLKYLLLAVAVGCVAAVSAGVSPGMRTGHLAAIVLFTAALAAIGFVHQWLAASKTFWWLLPVQHGQPVGGFVSRTHFAGYIALLCPAALALVYNAVSRRRFVAAVAWLDVMAAMFIVVACSLARGAIVALCVGMSATFAVAAAIRPLRENMVSGLALAACAIIVAVLLLRPGILPERVREQVTTRIATLRSPLKTDSAIARLDVWRDSLYAWSNYPFIGAGASGFRMVFPQHRLRTDRKSFKQAENEYVQTLVDMGIVGTFVMGWAFICVASAAARSARSGSLPPAITLAAPGIIAVCLVHNAIDFPIRTPLYALSLAWIAGMCLTPSPGESAFLSVPRRIAVPLAMAAAAIIIAAALVPSLSRSLNRDSPDHIQSAGIDELAAALQWSPTSWQTWYHLGWHACATGTRAGMRFGERCMTRAVEYDPNNYGLWETLAYLRRDMGNISGSQEAAERLKALRDYKKVSGTQPERF